MPWFRNVRVLVSVLDISCFDEKGGWELTRDSLTMTTPAPRDSVFMKSSNISS